MAASCKWLNHRTGLSLAIEARMRNLASFLLLPAFLLSACNGALDDDDEAAAAKCAEPPPAPVMNDAPRVLRLDVVELGERVGQQPATAGTIGMNLDARCTNDVSSRACNRPGNRAGL